MSQSSWRCSQCTFENRFNQNFCGMCSSPRSSYDPSSSVFKAQSHRASSSSSTFAHSDASAASWFCGVCQIIVEGTNVCLTCGRPRSLVSALFPAGLLGAVADPTRHTRGGQGGLNNISMDLSSCNSTVNVEASRRTKLHSSSSHSSSSSSAATTTRIASQESKAEPWKCMCAANNPAHLWSCSMCHSPRTDLLTPPGCQLPNAKRETRCVGCGSDRCRSADREDEEKKRGGRDTEAGDRMMMTTRAGSSSVTLAETNAQRRRHKALLSSSSQQQQQ